MRRGRVPSRTRLKIDPMRGSWRFWRSSAEGLGHSWSPFPVILKIPISEVEPKRFLEVLRILKS